MYVVSAGEYMRKGIAPSTLKSYDRAWIRFSGFCAAFGVSPRPVNMSVLCAFIVHCFESQKLHPSSIKALVSGIQFNVRCSEPSACSLLGNPSIRLLMNGLRKQRPETKDKRLPITLPLLHTLVSNLRQGCFGPYVDTLLESVFFTAFYGFLRCGEFTSRCATFDPCRDLTLSDVSVASDMFTVVLKHSKTDVACRGTPIVIARTNCVFCPLSSMSRYLLCRPRATPSEPLFVTDEGKAMTRSWFAQRLRVLCVRCGLAPELYTAHCFRIGAATWASSKVPTATLKMMGRWSSSAYERYVRPNALDILGAQRSMSFV